METFADPNTPCRLYQVPNTGAASTLNASTDSGQTWFTVFQDTTCNTLQPLYCFNGQSLLFPGRDRIWLTETGNGDALVASNDAGRTWSAENDGIAGQALEYATEAPNDADVAYGITGAPIYGRTPSRYSLFTTTSGGTAWAARQLPGMQPADLPLGSLVAEAGGDLPRIAIDPSDSSHLWVLVPAAIIPNVSSSNPSASVRWDLFESHDAAQSWVDRGSLPALPNAGTNSNGPLQGQQNTDIGQLLAIRSHDHQLRLIATGDFQGFPSDIAISDDDGSTWKPSPDTLPDWPVSVAAQQGNPDEVAVLDLKPSTGGRTQLLMSFDGLTTLAQMPWPSWWPCEVAGDCATLSTSRTTWPLQPANLQADNHGNFYVNSYIACSAVAQPVCPTSTSSRWFLTRYTPAVTGGSPSAAQTGSSALQAQPLVEVASCSLPLWTGAGGHESGSVAFDGHELLYTQFQETTDTSWGADTGVIHAMDARSCAQKANDDIEVSFSQGDIAAWAAANGLSPGQADQSLSIDDVTYDQVRNVLWATLGASGTQSSFGSDYGSQTVGLFAVAVQPGTQNPRRAIARLAFLNGCGWALAYDHVRDLLWTCNDSAGSVGRPESLDATAGSPVLTCAPRIAQSTATTMASWTLVSRSRALVWSEDDSTLDEFNTDTCALDAVYAHRAFSEPLGEDEEMACDTLSYGPGSGGLPVTGQPGSVIWLRDAEASLVTAWALPGEADCPVPTTTAYTGPHQVVTGSSIDLSATLAQVYLGGSAALSKLPLSFSISGSGVHETIATGITTNARGATGAVPWKATLPPGTYTLTATFEPGAATPSRASEYLGSIGIGQLVVLSLGNLSRGSAQAVQPPPFPARAGTLGEVSPPEPPATGSEQAQAQAQAQSQSQAQSQTTMQLQPGVMVQRRTREQVATQTQTQPSQTGAMLASRITPAQQAGVVLVAGSLMLGLGLLVQRPVAAVVTRRRFRRPRPRHR